MKKYAGVGSRDTPFSIQDNMFGIGYYLALRSFVLVSGGANGADKAFEYGCDHANGYKEIWVPELGFNGSKSDLLPSKDAFIVAERFVDHWRSCSDWAKSAHARNCHQVLGADLLSPVSFVICWTPEGKKIGGTATAIKIAEEYEIPVLNLGSKDYSDDEISDFLEKHI